MNSVKNLMIIAVLGAVGYGVYVSLSRNNPEPGPTPGVADGWPSDTKANAGNTSGIAATPKLGGPLPLSGSQTPSVGSVSGVSGVASPVAPPLGQVTPVAPPFVATSTSAPPLAGSTGGAATLDAPTSSAAADPASTATSWPATMTKPAQAATNPPASPPLAAMNPSPSSANPSGPSPERDAAAPSAAVRNLAPPPGVAKLRKAPSGPTEDVQNKFNAFMEEVQKRLNDGKLVEAHLALSIEYDDPNLPPEHAKQITVLLDQLAGTVIYSRQHYLEPAYVTAPGETIERIAQKYNVPWQLLARINGLMPPSAANTEEATKNQPLPIGIPLKVIRGPFDATIRLDRKELTLRLPSRQGQPLYAGRFPIGVGRDMPRLDGQYTVLNKAFNPTYRGPDGTTIQPGDPQNPLRDAWIGLSDRIGIHGAANPQAVGRDDNRGTICVGQRDLQDLYGILSVGSRVQILR
ncbi:MAG: L,D-transpeptidase family protein [Thermoguttaceae bacterium]